MSDHGQNGPSPDAQWASEGLNKRAQPAPHAPVVTGQPKAQKESQQPMGVVLWGLVLEEVEERLKKGVPKLSPKDWRSGDRLWVLPEAGKKEVEVIAPFGGAEAMVQDFKTNVFPDRSVSFVKLGAKGKEVGVF